MVITGDNKSTAEAICREIRLFSEGEDLKQKSYTGKEFMALSSNLQKQILSKSGGMVFSRAEPKHKQDIVRMLKEMGEIVAMTGDGVNDAPALKLADIGIAMGITGTEVSAQISCVMRRTLSVLHICELVNLSLAMARKISSSCLINIWELFHT